ncbi:hypothetical protein V8C86DRAFT_2555163 [Haematococcus lacustris]
MFSGCSWLRCLGSDGCGSNQCCQQQQQRCALNSDRSTRQSFAQSGEVEAPSLTQLNELLRKLGSAHARGEGLQCLLSTIATELHLPYLSFAVVCPGVEEYCVLAAYSKAHPGAVALGHPATVRGSCIDLLSHSKACHAVTIDPGGLASTTAQQLPDDWKHLAMQHGFTSFTVAAVPLRAESSADSLSSSIFAPPSLAALIAADHPNPHQPCRSCGTNGAGSHTTAVIPPGRLTSPGWVAALEAVALWLAAVLGALSQELLEQAALASKVRYELTRHISMITICSTAPRPST